MSRLIVLLVALLLPFQFAWSASVLCCPGDPGRAEAVVQASVDGPSGPASGEAVHCCAEPNCASCHAPTPPLIAAPLDVGVVAPHVASSPVGRSMAFASVSARVPDRPQWPALV